MVFFALNLNFLAASCCRVDVVNGADGLRLAFLRSTLEMWKSWASIFALASSAFVSVFKSNFSSFLPSRLIRWVRIEACVLVINSASIVQYSSLLKLAISYPIALLNIKSLILMIMFVHLHLKSFIQANTRLSLISPMKMVML